MHAHVGDWHTCTLVSAESGRNTERQRERHARLQCSDWVTEPPNQLFLAHTHRHMRSQQKQTTSTHAIHPVIWLGGATHIHTVLIGNATSWSWRLLLSIQMYVCFDSVVMWFFLFFQEKKNCLTLPARAPHHTVVSVSAFSILFHCFFLRRQRTRKQI